MLTIGLYNTYDTKKLHEAHIRAIARAAPVAYAFNFHLALIGFPFNEDDPKIIAENVASTTTIGEGGRYLLELSKSNKFHILEFPRRGFPPQFGISIATTSSPSSEKSISALKVAEDALRGKSFFLIIGLGRHGLPKEILKMSRYHLDITDGKGVSLETCTAIGIIPAKIRTLMEALKWRGQLRKLYPRL
ncbi:hypothetical protein A3L04_10440 [Thermococcus chitonophagus]|uniref:Uncharacterized protein conserved in archaea (DUF531) n=1 Tax=Thermococcus chitonophagus TaxID=54262 RepID=A0A170SMK6_9EURY|nr:DUF531 family protein [Thermococcus chitonophagus]ASJ17457.1 hypothetical protein A3L04_10440 [Thermococcus chitonophagus]CUX78104.1 Uncharacterized protein conserved in archaea (DUF531) [Thermococcus chitonophagus]